MPPLMVTRRNDPSGTFGRTIRSERIELMLCANDGAERSLRSTIRSLATGGRVSDDAELSILVRTPLEPSEPVLLSELLRITPREEGIECEVCDRSKKIRACLEVLPCDDGLCFRLRVKADRPLWLAEWTMGGFEFDRVIVPALGGQALDRSMPPGTSVSYKYPFWWNAQFAVGEMKEGTCSLFSRERAPRLKLLRVKKVGERFALTYGIEAEAPLESRVLEGEWFLDCRAGGWRVPADLHRAWIASAFGAPALEENPRAPEWMKKINFVLELWGARKDRVAPLHTFGQMVSRLDSWRRFHAPEETLVYLPGFAEHGIDSHAPDYHPSAELGGADEFRRLVAAAHQMGYRVMVHTNVLAMTFAHRLFPQFRKHQVVDCFGRAQTWGLDLDGDWLPEPYFAYINPGAKAWSDLMTKVIGRLVGSYKVDAVFLDQTLLAFNVSRGPNFLEGMRRHILRLERAFPHVLFAGEGMHEHLAGILPAAQIHGIDSLMEVHGMEECRAWRAAHPVSTYVFGDFTRFMAHLLTKHPSHPAFSVQEEAYEKLGVMPALCLYDNNQAMDIPETARMIRRAKELWR